MPKRLSRFGVGPRIAVSTAGYAILAGLVSRQWPHIFRLGLLAHPAFITIAVTLIVLGVPMYVIGVASVMRAYNRDQLVTSGAFALVRHPVYAAWIVFLLPGLALLSRSLPLLLTPLVAFATFKTLIGKEDDYLKARFGQTYLDYRARVREIVPLPRF